MKWNKTKESDSSYWQHYILCDDQMNRIIFDPPDPYAKGWIGIRESTWHNVGVREKFCGIALTKIDSKDFERWLDDPDVFWMEYLL